MKIKEGEAVIFPKFRCPQCNLPVQWEDTKRTTKTRQEREQMGKDETKERMRCPKCDSYLEQVMETSDDLEMQETVDPNIAPQPQEK
jgi:hypothetical protein